MGHRLLWKNQNDVAVSKFNSNFITVDVMSNGIASWRLSGFYGYPERNRRSNCWNLLRSIYASSTLSWFCVEDYNDLLQESEKKGNIDLSSWCFRGFRKRFLIVIFMT